jgi:hypothetical protein
VAATVKVELYAALDGAAVVTLIVWFVLGAGVVIVKVPFVDPRMV